MKTKESFTINGAYPEDLIAGYSTIKTTGRERLEKSLDTIMTKRDGEILRSSRFLARVIKVEFVIKGSSMEDMRSKLRELNSLLNVEGAVFVFDDEPDVFYVGSPVLDDEGSDTKNGLIGSYSINCLDPFKYAIEETTINGVRSGDTIGIRATYNGTAPSRPRFEVDFATDETGGSIGSGADCGYVMISKNGTDYSLQFGDDEQKDTGTQTKIATNFKAETKGARWNDTTALPLPSSAYTTPSGASTSFSSSEGVQASAYGSGAGKYHGALLVHDLGSNMSGEFEINWKQVFCLASDATTAKKQGGAFGVLLYDDHNALAYAYMLIKGNTTTTTGSALLFTPDQGIRTVKSGASFAYTSPTGYTKIGGVTRKSKQTIKRVQREGLWYLSINCGQFQDDNIGGWETIPNIRKIAFFFGRYSSNATMYKNTLIEASVVEGDVDLINTFGSGDVLEINTEDMSVLLNSKDSAQIGDIGNDWADMTLTPGANIFVCQWSDWVTAGKEPAFKMTYRERYL